MEIQLGNRTLTGLDSIDLRVALLLWGDAGCGKTTLASTAPGKKLWVQFDPDGVLSLRGRDDIVVLDLSGEKHAVVEALKSDDPMGLEKVLKEHPEIKTVVIDSLTALARLAMESAVANLPKATHEQPGLQGYGYRNTVVLRIVTSFMRLTKRLNRHIILIAHEDTATMDDKGVVQYVTLALGGKQTNQIALALNEVWWMSDTGKEYRIAVRPCRTRKPMKTRMFDSSALEFVWKYNVAKWSGDGIESWFEAWKENGGRKLAVPK
jgi:phage nucleotide-binding protein